MEGKRFSTATLIAYDRLGNELYRCVVTAKTLAILIKAMAIFKHDTEFGDPEVARVETIY